MNRSILFFKCQTLPPNPWLDCYRSNFQQKTLSSLMKNHTPPQKLGFPLWYAFERFKIAKCPLNAYAPSLLPSPYQMPILVIVFHFTPYDSDSRVTDQRNMEKKKKTMTKNISRKRKKGILFKLEVFPSLIPRIMATKLIDEIKKEEILKLCRFCHCSSLSL